MRNVGAMRAFVITALLLLPCVLPAQRRPLDEAAALARTIDGLTLISEIQGASHRSAFDRERVDRVPGIVTAVVPSRGFYMQSPLPDESPATSEGIYVKTRKVRDVSVGDLVVLDDVRVEEYYQNGVASGMLPVTRLKLPDITVIGSGFALPEPVVIGEKGRIPPSEVYTDDSGGEAGGDTERSFFDPENDGIDFYESLEGMLVRIENIRAVGTIHTRYGEIHVVGDDGAHAGLMTGRGGLVVRPGDFNPERIMVDVIENPSIAEQPPGFSMVVGDRFSGPITGVMDYSYYSYKILPIHTVPSVIPANLPRETTDLVPRDDRLSIATFNVFNLAGDDPQERFEEIAGTISVALKSPDIVVLSEVQDGDGARDGDLVDATYTVSRLTDAIRGHGGPDYAYIDIAPEDDRDGGEPGGNIRVGFLYNPARVTPAPGVRDDDPNRDVEASPSEEYGVALTPNPGRIDPRNTAFVGSRKPLVAHFLFGDRSIYLIGVHLTSKGGDGQLFGRSQPPVLGSETRRRRQVESIIEFVRRLLRIDPAAALIVAGDFNDFWFSSPLVELEKTGLRNLAVELLPEGERYTYVYKGNSQALDHILVSDSFFESSRPEVDIVHRYAEYLYGVRQSDHDPIHALFAFGDE